MSLSSEESNESCEFNDSDSDEASIASGEGGCVFNHVSKSHTNRSHGTGCCNQDQSVLAWFIGGVLFGMVACPVVVIGTLFWVVWQVLWGYVACIAWIQRMQSDGWYRTDCNRTKIHPKGPTKTPGSQSPQKRRKAVSLCPSSSSSEVLWC